MQTIIDEQNQNKPSNTTIDTDNHVIDQDNQSHQHLHDFESQDTMANEIEIPSDHD